MGGGENQARGQYHEDRKAVEKDMVKIFHEIEGKTLLDAWNKTVAQEELYLTQEAQENMMSFVEENMDENFSDDSVDYASHEAEDNE